MNKEDIEAAAIDVAEEIGLRLDNACGCPTCRERHDQPRIKAFAIALQDKLAKQSEPVAMYCGYSHSTGHAFRADAVIDVGTYLYTHPLPQPDLVEEIEALNSLVGYHVTGQKRLCSDIKELRQQLSAAQASEAALLTALEEVEAKYFAFLKEKDTDAEKFKAEGDMYGWNYHTGERAGATWVHLFMTNLLKLAAAHKARRLLSDECTGSYVDSGQLDKAVRDTKKMMGVDDSQTRKG